MTIVHTGADEPLVALYPDGSTRAGTIADLVEIAASYADAPETAADGLPVAVYHRVDDRLEPANVFIDHTPASQPGGRCAIAMRVFRSTPGTGELASAWTTY
jgi:hypothetical protein